ncbi:Possible glucanotransferase (putative endo alpha-1,4 polygalactosaminidase related protein) [Carnobacterium sp. AT7]|uniref:endo alpha-1,4 polygalactosaminidase n=1 Tax=Carnobacterium TaxID=2747 RepID=UPI00015F1AEA|nr:endo alpha-1,4 polygalactosaminidase [Carnobacterium sp. AT7]EDP68671.1 Possible glucanotransferase (putative endo alpha-1,4 polygalactosaminidase related protein) [Carnobacterium sp. AT7]
MKTTAIRFLIGVMAILGVTACAKSEEKSNNINENTGDYGVFLSLDGSEAIEASEGYETAIIDAQNLSKSEIAEMQDRGQEVYSYLNVGSLETYRPYFEDFQHLTLRPYENWEEEYWVDVTNEDWQEFSAVTLANELLDKGIDGFWIDNVDVYWQFPTEETYVGVEQILKTLMSYGKPVLINGGNEFVSAYFQKNQQIDDILTGVNQETVFSAIDFEKNELIAQSKENQDYYLNYLDTLDEAGKEIYLLEYTTDNGIAKEIKNYASKRDWQYYISNSIELDG